MSRFSFLDRIYSQKSDGVDTELVKDLVRQGGTP